MTSDELIGRAGDAVAVLIGLPLAPFIAVGAVLYLAYFVVAAAPAHYGFWL